MSPETTTVRSACKRSCLCLHVSCHPLHTPSFLPHCTCLALLLFISVVQIFASIKMIISYSLTFLLPSDIYSDAVNKSKDSFRQVRNTQFYIKPPWDKHRCLGPKQLTVQTWSFDNYPTWFDVHTMESGLRNAKMNPGTKWLFDSLLEQPSK